MIYGHRVQYTIDIWSLQVKFPLTPMTVLVRIPPGLNTVRGYGVGGVLGAPVVARGTASGAFPTNLVAKRPGSVRSSYWTNRGEKSFGRVRLWRKVVRARSFRPLVCPRRGATPPLPGSGRPGSRPCDGFCGGDAFRHKRKPAPPLPLRLRGRTDRAGAPRLRDLSLPPRRRARRGIVVRRDGSTATAGTGHRTRPPPGPGYHGPTPRTPTTTTTPPKHR